MAFFDYSPQQSTYFNTSPTDSNVAGGWGVEVSRRVINGASDLMGEIFGDAGKHARFAVGVADLPGNVATEIDGIFEIA